MQITNEEELRLRRLKDRHGEERLAGLLGVSHIALARAVARFDLRSTTYQRLATRLAELVAESPAGAHEGGQSKRED